MTSPRLVLPKPIYREILSVVQSCGVETGVRLLGNSCGSDYLVKHVIGPGPKASHRFATYECDNTYAEKEYARLLDADPDLKFLGELHVHPTGFLRFSSTDMETIREVLKDYPVFIAGIMQRNPFRIYPVLFPEQKEMEVVCELYKKPKGKKSLRRKARVYRRLWLRRVRNFRYVCKRRDRKADAD
jgi:hypothetical protein